MYLESGFPYRQIVFWTIREKKEIVLESEPHTHGEGRGRENTVGCEGLALGWGGWKGVGARPPPSCLSIESFESVNLGGTAW